MISSLAYELNLCGVVRACWAACAAGRVVVGRGAGYSSHQK